MPVLFFSGTVSKMRWRSVNIMEATKYITEGFTMYTFKITFYLFNGGRKCYTVKAGSPDAAIEKARNKARRDCLDATGKISIYRVGQIMPAQELGITI